MPDLALRSAFASVGEVVSIGRAERVPEAEWNALAHRGFHLHRWFVAAERHGWLPRHLATGGGSGFSAIVPVYLADHGSLHDLRYRWLGPLAAAVARSGLDLQPTLTVQSPFSAVSDPLGDLATASDSLLHTLLATLERRAVEDDAAVAVWPFIESGWGERLLQVGQARGWIAVYAGATARLPIQWDSFEAYVASRPPDLRRAIDGEMEWLCREGVECGHSTNFREDVEQLERLWAGAHGRPDGKAPGIAGFLRALAQTDSPDVAAQLSRQAGRLVGSSVALTGREILDVAFPAFDPDRHCGPICSSNLVYLPIGRACAAGSAEVDLGPTALHPKLLRGATLRRRTTLIKGTTAACHQLLRAIGELAGRRLQWKEYRALARR